MKEGWRRESQARKGAAKQFFRRRNFKAGVVVEVVVEGDVMFWVRL